MSEMKALAWKEWRQIRRDALAMTAIGLAWIVFARFVMRLAVGPSLELGAASVTLASFLVMTAMGLGATTTAGDGALAFAGARPVSCTWRVATRLGMRLMALIGVTLVTSLALVAAFAAVPTDAGDQWLPENRTAVHLVAAATLLASFGAAALVSAFARRALAAVLGATCLVIVLALAGHWLLGSMTEDPWALVIATGGVALVMLTLATAATAMRSGEAPLGPPAAARLLVASVVLPALVLSAWCVGGPIVVKAHARSVQAECEARFPELATAAKAGDQDANDAAIALERAAAPLQVDLVPRSRGGLVARLPSPGRTTVYDLSLRKWNEQQLLNPTGTVAPPPVDVRELLTRHAADLDVVRKLLVEGEAPRWETGRTVEGWQMVPNLYGFLELRRWLLADALACVADGRIEAAVADLEANWRLCESLSARPDFQSQVTAVGVARSAAAALRKLPDIPISWDARLDVERLRGGVVAGLAANAADLFEAAREAPEVYWQRSSRGSKWILEAIERSELLQAARYDVDAGRVMRQRGHCGPLGLPGDPEHEMWRTNGISSSLDRAGLQLELTRKLAQLQRLRAADPAGAWPASVPGIETSWCSRVTWTYSPAGPVLLEARGVDSSTWDGELRGLPLRYEIK